MHNSAYRLTSKLETKVNRLKEQHDSDRRLYLCRTRVKRRTDHGFRQSGFEQGLLDSGSTFNYASPEHMTNIRQIHDRTVCITGLNGTYYPKFEGMVTLRVKDGTGTAPTRDVSFWCYPLPPSLCDNQSTNRLRIILGAKALERLGLLTMPVSPTTMDTSLLPMLSDFIKHKPRKTRRQYPATKPHRVSGRKPKQALRPHGSLHLLDSYEEETTRLRNMHCSFTNPAETVHDFVNQSDDVDNYCDEVQVKAKTSAGSISLFTIDNAFWTPVDRGKPDLSNIPKDIDGRPVEHHDIPVCFVMTDDQKMLQQMDDLLVSMTSSGKPDSPADNASATATTSSSKSTVPATSVDKSDAPVVKGNAPAGPSAVKQSKRKSRLSGKRKRGHRRRAARKASSASQPEGISMISQEAVSRIAQKPLPCKGEVIFSVDDVVIGEGNPKMTPQHIKKIRALLMQFIDVLATEAIPKPCKAPTVKLFPKDPKTQDVHCATPKWTPAVMRYLQLVREQLMSFGVIERVTDDTPVTATCRVTLILKKGGEEIRVCFDARPVNKILMSPSAHFPNLPEMVHRASRKADFKTKLDFQSAYLQRVIDKDSRHFVGVWLPDEHGVPRRYRYVRLIWGLHTAAASMVNFVHDVMQGLPDDLANRIAYYVDDVLIPSESFDQHYQDLEKFLKLCRQHGLTIHPKKFKIACGPEVEFLGYKCGNGESSMSRENIAAITAMPRPVSKKEVMHVLGVFSTARRYVRDYAGKAAPLIALLKKNALFKWTKECEASFKELKNSIQQQHKHTVFDPKLPLVIHCDASAYAGGCWLAQIAKDGEYKSLAFFSTTFSPAQRVWSAFMREAYTCLWSLLKCENWMNSSPHETIVYTDAHSLQFVQSATRSELSSRLLAKTSHLRYKIVYISGASNIVADALSRFRNRGPHEMTDATKREAMSRLLDELPHHLKPKKRVYIYFADMDKQAYRMLQLWRSPSNQMQRGHPKDLSRLSDWDYAIVHVHPKDQVRVAQRLFERDQPFAMLMCMDLVSRIFITKERDDDTANVLLEKVSKAAKLAYICRNHIWLVHKIQHVKSHITLATAVATGITAISTRSQTAAANAKSTIQTRSRSGAAQRRKQYGVRKRKRQVKRGVTVSKKQTREALAQQVVSPQFDDRTSVAPDKLVPRRKPKSTPARHDDDLTGDVREVPPPAKKVKKNQQKQNRTEREIQYSPSPNTATQTTTTSSAATHLVPDTRPVDLTTDNEPEKATPPPVSQEHGASAPNAAIGPADVSALEVNDVWSEGEPPDTSTRIFHPHLQTVEGNRQ